MRGAVGGQFGLGFHATNRVSVEGLQKMLAITARTTVSNVSFNLGRGNIAGVHFNLKYDF